MSNLRKQKTGQVFTIDLAFSALLFIIMVIFLLSVWNLYSKHLQEQQVTGEIELTAFQIADLLVSSPGVPNNWEGLNTTQIITLGLIMEDRKVSSSKKTAFFALNYTQLKRLFNVERYNLQVRLMDLNGTTLQQIGIAPTNSSDRSVSLQKLVLDGNTPRRLVTTLWSS